GLPTVERPLLRSVDAYPFVPPAEEQLQERCEEIFQTQVAGLAKRLDAVGPTPLTIGVSGGLASTLALLGACKTVDALGGRRRAVHAFTLPGFGTRPRTLANARALMQHLGVTPREIDVRPLCLEQWKALGHRPFGIELSGLSVEGLTERLRA